MGFDASTSRYTMGIAWRRLTGGTLAGAVCVLMLGTGAANAAIIEVDSATDDGTDCTLREAIASAGGNADSGCTGSGTYGDDTITFAPGVTGTIPLASQLVIDPTQPGTLEIQGPGAGVLAVSGQDTLPVLRITSLANSAANAVTISGLTIRDGRMTGTDPNFNVFGAGIYNNGRLNLDRVTVTENQIAVDVGGPAVFALGGGIYNAVGSAVITNSTVSNNTISGIAGVLAVSAGGGVYASNGSVTVRRSTISGNAVGATAELAAATALGGGIHVSAQTGSVSGALEQTTVAGNTATAASTMGTATARGGGASAETSGGGAASLSAAGATIAGNGALTGANLGIAPDGPSTSITSTVLAEPAGGGTNCNAAPTSGGHNLSDDASCVFSGTGDMNSTEANLLLPADNGGPTLTMRPAPPAVGTPSPLLDGGVAAGGTSDQRGFGRTVDLDLANGAGGDGTDIGAFEVQAGATPTATNPASPHANQNPSVTGTALPDTEGVRLFSGTSCATEVGSGTPGDFANPGFTVGPLAQGTTTNFRATGQYGTASSLCSASGVSYTVPAPPPPPDTGTNPPVTPPPAAPPAASKCKKGQKLKGGRCVKKKRKKRP